MCGWHCPLLDLIPNASSGLERITILIKYAPTFRPCVSATKVTEIADLNVSEADTSLCLCASCKWGVVTLEVLGSFGSHGGTDAPCTELPRLHQGMCTCNWNGDFGG